MAKKKTSAKPARVAHPKRARDWGPAFLAALAECPNVTAAAAAAGCSRRAPYLRRAAEADFAAAWDDALDASTDHLVGEAYRRAFRGTERPVFHQGERCGAIREYSDTLAIFLLKAHRPGVYRETVKQEHTGGLTIRYVNDWRSPSLPESGE